MLRNWLTFYLQCWRPYRYRQAPAGLSDFIIPTFNAAFFVRLITLIIVSYIVFGIFLIPAYIKGGSMEPTYKRIGVNFCWRMRYLLHDPQRKDIVIIYYADKVLLLKRVVAFEGETVEFRNGDLYINGIKIEEPYVKYACDWNLPPRKVKKDHIYVVGDNRSMPIEQHKFGQVAKDRIYGAPLW
jgi:signal peptidase I